MVVCVSWGKQEGRVKSVVVCCVLRPCTISVISLASVTHLLCVFLLKQCGYEMLFAAKRHTNKRCTWAVLAVFTLAEKNQIQVTPAQGAWGILCWKLTCETQGVPPYSSHLSDGSETPDDVTTKCHYRTRQSHNPSSVVELVVYYVGVFPHSTYLSHLAKTTFFNYDLKCIQILESNYFFR